VDFLKRILDQLSVTKFGMIVVLEISLNFELSLKILTFVSVNISLGTLFRAHFVANYGI